MAQAQLTLTVDAQNKAGRALDRAEAQVAKLRKQLGQVAKQSKDNERANRRLRKSFKRLNNQMNRARGGFSKTKSALVGLGAVFAGGLMVDGIKDAGLFQAQIASLCDDVGATRARL